jgi:hypothetical protein
MAEVKVLRLLPLRPDAPHVRAATAALAINFRQII